MASKAAAGPGENHKHDLWDSDQPQSPGIPSISVLLRVQSGQPASHLQSLGPLLLELFAVLLCFLALQPINGAQELQGLAEVLLFHQQLLLQQGAPG